MAKLVFEFTGKSTELSQTIAGVKAMYVDLAKVASQPANAGRSSGISSALDQQRKQLGLMRGDYDAITAAAIEFRRKGAPQELITQYVALRREILANEAASTAAAAQKKAQQDAELAQARQLAQIEEARRQAANRRQAGLISRGESSSAQSQAARGNVEAAISSQRVELQRLNGTYDAVLASALKFKQQGAPTELITQYIRLRREIQATENAQAAAAAQRKADQDAEIANERRLSQIQEARIQSASRRQSSKLRDAETASGRSQAVRGSLQNEIAAERAELQRLQGTYDGVLATALKYKQQGAPTELILQYIRLRREIQSTKAAKDSAAAQLKADKDAELALIARNAAYEESQARLAMQRDRDRRSQMARSGGPGGPGGRGMAGGMMFPMAMNSLAVGFQDAVSVYQVNGSALSAISAAGNNIIFLLTLLNPMAGAIGAITLGLTQLGIAWLTSGDNAEASAKKQEEAAKRIEDSLSRELELRRALAEGDASTVDNEVGKLSKELRNLDNVDIPTLQKKLQTATDEKKSVVANGGIIDLPSEKQAIEKQLEAAWAKRRETANALETAQGLQAGITPLMRNADRRNDSGQAKTITELSEELKVLNGKMTEREAFISKEVRGGGSRIAAGEEFDLREQIKAKEKEKEDAKAAAKEAERANETAAKKKEADQQKRETEATALRERLMNPNERYRDEVGKFRAQYDAGDIDQETFQRAEKDARKKRDEDLMQKIPERVSHAPSLLKGTVEAARVASTGRRDEKMQQLAEQQLAEAKRQTRIQERAFRNPLQKSPVAKEY